MSRLALTNVEYVNDYRFAEVAESDHQTLPSRSEGRVWQGLLFISLFIFRFRSRSHTQLTKGMVSLVWPQGQIQALEWGAYSPLRSRLVAVEGGLRGSAENMLYIVNGPGTDSHPCVHWVCIVIMITSGGNRLQASPNFHPGLSSRGNRLQASPYLHPGLSSRTFYIPQCILLPIWCRCGWI